MEKREPENLRDVITVANGIREEIKECRMEARAWRESIDLGKTSGAIGMTAGLVIGILCYAAVQWIKARIQA